MRDEISLELLREGDEHNQLLSPHTRYLAICGDAAPVTLSLDMEHKKLLDQISQLRYVRKDGSVIDAGTRTSVLRELGQTVGQWLGKIQAFNIELSRSQTARIDLLHLRLVLFGSELSLIPFELAILPKGFVAEGLPLAFQPNIPITMTREVRRSRPMPVAWDRPPRILFVSAAPQNMTVPAKAHVAALRSAINPWVKWAPSVEERVQNVKSLLTVITDASLESIRQACDNTDYTHVHVLAHGVPFDDGGEDRYAFAMCADGNPARVDHVTGRQLAIALRGKGLGPSVVTLMTCDSANQGSMLAPGGSIAHELHAYGVPWVIASQFPLTKTGSVAVTESLYRRLLLGEDPREVLREIRRRLYSQSNTNHDWASLVTYAALPPDLTHQVARFRDKQLRKMLDVAFDKADKVEGGHRELVEPLKALDQRIRDLPDEHDALARDERSEWLGMKAASEKRRAQLLFRQQHPEKARDGLKSARHYYEDALHADLNNHWPLVQFLSLSLILEEAVDPFWWGLARHKAKGDITGSTRSGSRAWAYGTLAELEMLEFVTRKRVDEERAVIARVRDHCRAIVQLEGETSFPVFSTWRQFNRYLHWWDRDDWRPVAEAAVEALTPSTGIPKEWLRDR